MPQTEQQTREEWLAGLKVGDEVKIRSGIGWWRTTIESETAKSWLIGTLEFSKSDGEEIDPLSQWGGSLSLDAIAVLKGENRCD